jgi:Dickkopf N-terminal cysteine-rich region
MFAVKRRVCAALCLLTFGLIGCGGDGNGAGNKQAFIASLCDLFSPCCVMAALPSDGATCRALLGAELASSTYNAQLGSQCLAEGRAAAMAPSFCSTGGNGAAPSCSLVFTSTTIGGAQPGQACMQDSDCAPSADGVVDCAFGFANGVQTHKCQVELLNATEGSSPCIGVVEADGSMILEGSNTDIPARGYLCDTAQGLDCDPTSSVCVRSKAVGEACSGFSEHVCVADAYCDSGQSQCLEKKPIGAACSGVSGECKAQAYCDRPQNELEGSCAAVIADGAPCTSSEQCASTSCSNGVCAKTVTISGILCGG